MENQIRIFICRYEENTSCYCHPEFETRIRIVKAFNESQASDIILEFNDDTTVEQWEITEIPQTPELSIFDDYGDKLL